jgi:chromosome segregation ATPase
MPNQAMTYDELASLWGVSREAARKKVEGLHLPRQPGNDGKVRVMINLVEVRHQPKKTGRRAGGDRAEVIAALEGHVETLKEALAKAEAETSRERERGDRLDRELDVARRDLDDERARAVVAVAEAATVPALKDTIAALRTALDGEKTRIAEIRAERDRLAARRWWPWRRAG